MNTSWIRTATITVIDVALLCTAPLLIELFSHLP